MARFNEILTGRYNRFLQKLLQMKGGPPSAQLASEIQPGFNVEQLPVELRVLMAFDRYYVATSIVGVAAQDSAIQLGNAGASNALMVIEQLLITVAAASVINPSISFPQVLTNLTNTVAPTRVDARGNPRSPLIISSQNNLNVDLGLGLGALFVPNVLDLITDANEEIVLAPGTQLRFRNTTVNVSWGIWAIMRQRSLEESETTV